MITGNDIIKIKNYLEGKKIIHIQNEVTKMDLRKQGHVFPLSEHVRGMVYSMLSAQTKWANIEKNMDNIDQLFFHFDVSKIVSHDFTYFYNGLGKWSARGRLTKGQLKELHHNISVMQEIEKKYGSMDAFVISKPVNEIMESLSNPKSQYKLKMMGEALVCEYLRNVGVDCFKPDVHLKRMLGANRLAASMQSDPSFADLNAIMLKLSEETGLWMGQIDYILWAYCASEFGEICTADPKCDQCVVCDKCRKK